LISGIKLKLVSFGNMLLALKGKETSSFQLKLRDNFVTDSRNIANAFANRFKSILYITYPTISSSHFVT
jgi:hypothetical protein